MAVFSAIRQCKYALNRSNYNYALKKSKQYPESAVTFLFSRVGSNPAADRFLRGIAQSRTVGKQVYASLEDLSRKKEVFDSVSGDKEYMEKVSLLYLPAYCASSECVGADWRYLQLVRMFAAALNAGT